MDSWRASLSVETCPSYAATVFSYAGMDEGIEFSVNPRLGTCVIDTSPVTTSTASEPMFSDFDEVADDENDIDMYTGVHRNDIASPVGSNVASYDSSSSDGSCSEGTEGDTEEEVTPPNVQIGLMTGVRLTTFTQIHRRARRWKCRGNDVQQENEKQGPPEMDIRAYAKRAMISLDLLGDFGITQMSDLSTALVKATAGYDEAAWSRPGLRQGWARRPPNGKMYGVKYINRYADEVRELFHQGENNKSEKLGPARMLEELRARYPRRYDLPSENEIRAEIGRLMGLSRKRKIDAVVATDADEENGDDVRVRKRSGRMEDEFAAFLGRLVTEDVLILPHVGLAKFSTHQGANSLHLLRSFMSRHTRCV